MSPASRCYPRRRRHPGRRPLRGPRDALEAILFVATSPARHETICLLLDHAHCGVSAVVIEGPEADDDLLGVGQMLIDACGQADTIGAIVLATVRPGQSHEPSGYDQGRWFDLRARFEEAGVELLDWFVVAGGLAASLCEITDSRWRWLDDAP